MPDSPSVPVEAQEAILAWYAVNGRPLAFRLTADPYAILVSEAMAQQTQASRAADRWSGFMARYPTVLDLAAGSPADVQRAWQGLGYNRRALALWRAARMIVTDYGGRLPASVAELERLPGVGPYTARALAAIAFGERVGAVDVNTRRVLGRMVFGATDAADVGDLQAVADASVPAGRSADWTHALMDLGATLCRAGATRCEVCPARPWCRYAARFRPGLKPRPATPRRATPTPPFATTNRWLRGRILDRLRAAAGKSWVTLDGPIGSHDVDRVRRAARTLAAEGLIEIDSPDERGLRARLATT